MSTENKIDLKSLSPDALKELKAEVAKEEKEKKAGNDDHFLTAAFQPAFIWDTGGRGETGGR